MTTSLSSTTRLVLLDLEAPATADLDLAALRGLLAEARRRGLPIVHGYRTDRRAGAPGHTPLEGLSPLPNEPVFLCGEPSAFSSRAFGAWVGAAPGSLVFVGGAEAVRRSAQAAAAAGYCVYILVEPANADGPDAYWRQLHPYLPSRFFAPAKIALDSISDATRGAANGQG